MPDASDKMAKSIIGLSGVFVKYMGWVQLVFSAKNRKINKPIK